MSCIICYNNNINNNINCRVCRNSTCNNCFANILLSDKTLPFVLLKIYLSYIIVVIVNHVIDYKKTIITFNKN